MNNVIAQYIVLARNVVNHSTIGNGHYFSFVCPLYYTLQLWLGERVEITVNSFILELSLTTLKDSSKRLEKVKKIKLLEFETA